MQKQAQIIDMFNNISKTYDLLNHLLSFGIDKRWRKTACKNAFILCQKDKLEISDVACGTGDMLVAWKQMADKKNIKAKLNGIDPAVKMLEVAKEKLDANFIEASATDLPLLENSQDLISISYGIRNVVEIDKAIGEFARVLKTDGLLVILEFTRPLKKNFINSFARWYLKKALPIIGRIISKDKGAYQYLPDSIDDFLSTKELCQKLEAKGFKIEQTKAQNFEVSTTIIAKKITSPFG